jgi:hypothetical protein
MAWCSNVQYSIAKVLLFEREKEEVRACEDLFAFNILCELPISFALA